MVMYWNIWPEQALQPVNRDPKNKLDKLLSEWQRCRWFWFGTGQEPGSPPEVSETTGAPVPLWGCPNSVSVQIHSPRCKVQFVRLSFKARKYLCRSSIQFAACWLTHNTLKFYCNSSSENLHQFSCFAMQKLQALLFSEHFSFVSSDQSLQHLNHVTPI